MSTPPDFTSIDLDLEALADALSAIQEALEEFPDDLRARVRVEPLDGAAVDQATRCGAGHVSHVDRDGRWSCPCRPADPDAQGIDLSATDGGWRVVVAGSDNEGVLVIPMEDGDLLVIHDEGTYVVDDVWAASEIAIGIALDLSAAGALKDWDDETEQGFAKRADGTVLLPWMCAC